jgi:hypothetical protein
VRVFISSVRRGLEQERDALPGLLKAIGHEPVRFEDFTAQQVPSRQACMDGVDSADVYVLLVGPAYGHKFPETGQSATHDEYMRARERGIPRLVFLKSGVEMDADQEAFVSDLSDYGSGLFRASFSDVSDLLTKVAAALGEVAESPGDLTYEALDGTVEVKWREEWEDAYYRGRRSETYAELHVVGLASRRIPARVMRTMPERLVSALRASGMLEAHAGANPRLDDGSAVVEIPPADDRRIRDAVQPSRLMGVRVDNGAQASAWWSLPTDGMGGIVNVADLTSMASKALRFVGTAGVFDAEQRLAVAIALNGSMFSVIDGQLPTSSRTNASFGTMRDEPIRVLPDESVSATVLDLAAEEYGRELSASLLEAIKSVR